MGTTPRLGTTAAAKPTTGKRGMTPPLERQLDQLERMERLPNPVREYASPTTLTTMNYKMLKTVTPMGTVQTKFIIISTNVHCGTQMLNRS